MLAFIPFLRFFFVLARFSFLSFRQAPPARLHTVFIFKAGISVFQKALMLGMSFWSYSKHYSSWSS